jgi:hypothetical protein
MPTRLHDTGRKLRTLPMGKVRRAAKLLAERLGAADCGPRLMTRGARRTELPLSATTPRVRAALGLSGRDNRTIAKQRRYQIKPDLPRKARNGREYRISDKQLLIQNVKTGADQSDRDNNVRKLLHDLVL